MAAAGNTFRHVIITGGSSGIGKETAKVFARRGADVTLIARRPDVLAQARDDVMAACTASSQKVLALAADVSDRPLIEKAVRQACDDLGPCDLLVTSAGIARPGYFQDMDIETFERDMAINYFGTLYTVRAVVPEMRARRRGHVVLVSSGLGIVGVLGYAAYSPSKFALRGLAESIRWECGVDGVGVSIVYPPDTDTPQLAAEIAHKPVETAAVTGGAKTWRPEDVAACIAAGVAAGRFVITPGWEMTWLFRMHSILMRPLNWYFDLVANRARTQDSK
jgi:3-dehydrosphinganine reductase